MSVEVIPGIKLKVTDATTPLEIIFESKLLAAHVYDPLLIVHVTVLPAELDEGPPLRLTPITSEE
jgi:hypothetical protein